MEKIPSKNLSPIELFKLKCKDLDNIGPEKPVGYLLLETVRGCVGKNTKEDIEGIIHYLHDKGLDLAIFKGDGWPGAGLCSVLYAYDKTSLQKILDEHKQILLDANWPTTADEFVANLKTQEKIGTPLYKVIAKTFGDKFSEELEEEK